MVLFYVAARMKHSGLYTRSGNLLSIGGIVLLIGWISLQACRKPEPDQPGYYPSDELIRSLFFFKEGSYWIYKDSISGDRVTILMDYAGYWINKVHNGNQYLYDEHEYRASLHYSFDDRYRSLSYRSGRIDDSYGFERSFILMSNTTRPPANWAEERIFITPIDDVDNSRAGSIFSTTHGNFLSTITIDRVEDSFNIKAVWHAPPYYRTFIQGSVTGIASSLEYGLPDTEYWFAPGIGLIKIRCNGHVYELNTYQAVPID